MTSFIAGKKIIPRMCVFTLILILIISFIRHNAACLMMDWSNTQIQTHCDWRKYKILTVSVFGLYPLPPGHRVLYSSLSTSGQSSHLGPHARPTLQQHVDFVTGLPIS